MPAFPNLARRFPAVLAALALGLALTGPVAAEPAGAADYLARANAAFAAERMVAPAGDNALEWMLAARAVEPDSERVREGLNDLYPLVVAAIDREIARGNSAEALRVIALLEAAIPNSLAARQARARLGVAARPAPQVAALSRTP
jgi:protein TonB